MRACVCALRSVRQPSFLDWPPPVSATRSTAASWQSRPTARCPPPSGFQCYGTRDLATGQRHPCSVTHSALQLPIGCTLCKFGIPAKSHLSFQYEPNALPASNGGPIFWVDERSFKEARNHFFSWRWLVFAKTLRFHFFSHSENILME